VITNFVVAGAGDAESVVTAFGPTKQWPGLNADCVDPMKLCALAFILKGRPLDQSELGVYSQQFTILASRTDKGPWVVLVPADLVLLLASLPEASVPGISQQWFETEWFQNEPSWHLQAIGPLLDQLSRLAARAEATSKTMFICMSP
jgi:hypothetical protein